MIVMSRMPKESLMINDDIEVTIVEIKGDRVRIAIDAPKNIIVHRKEVWEAIKKGIPQKKNK